MVMPLDELKDSTAIHSTVKSSFAGVSGLEFPSVSVVVQFSSRVGPINSWEQSIRISQNAFNGFSEIISKRLDYLFR